MVIVVSFGILAAGDRGVMLVVNVECIEQRKNILVLGFILFIEYIK